MIKYAAVFVLLGSLATASLAVDCNDPKNVTECAKIAYSRSEMKYHDFMARAVATFKKKTNPGYVDSFLELEKQWRSLAKSQCNHLREFYQGGSLGTSSYISCLDVMYGMRVEELKTIYDDILGER